MNWETYLNTYEDSEPLPESTREYHARSMAERLVCTAYESMGYMPNALGPRAMLTNCALSSAELVWGFKVGGLRKHLKMREVFDNTEAVFPQGSKQEPQETQAPEGDEEDHG